MRRRSSSKRRHLSTCSWRKSEMRRCALHDEAEGGCWLPGREVWEEEAVLVER